MKCMVWKIIIPDAVAPVRAEFNGSNPRVIHVGMQADKIVVWVEHDADNTQGNTWLSFTFRGTGPSFAYDSRWMPCGTVIDDVNDVWHVLFTEED